MSQAPDIVFIDPRVAFRLPSSKANAAEVQAGGSAEPVGYIRQDIHEKAVRSAGTRERETIVQILTNPDGRLVGLSSWGRVWAFVSEKKEDLPAWVAITDFLPQAELSS